MVPFLVFVTQLAVTYALNKNAVLLKEDRYLERGCWQHCIVYLISCFDQSLEHVAMLIKHLWCQLYACFELHSAVNSKLNLKVSSFKTGCNSAASVTVEQLL